MRYLHTFESFIYEAAGKKVVFFPGRFQPFHSGHLEALRRTSQEFGLPVIPVQIVSKREESPFPPSLLERIGKDVAKSNSFIADFVIYPQGRNTFLGEIISYLRDLGYDPQGLGCGSDRLVDYTKQIAYINGPKGAADLPTGFVAKMVDSRASDGPSGTKVRQALQDGDQLSFNRMMPKELHKYYKDFEKYIK